jgi:hypothetical protein
VLLVLDPDDGIADRSFANLQNVQTMQVSELNAYDILRCDWVVFTDATVPGESEPVTGSSPTARPARAATKKAATSADDSAAAPMQASDSEAAPATDDTPATETDTESEGSDQ